MSEQKNQGEAKHTPTPWRCDHAVVRSIGGNAPDRHEYHLFSSAPGPDFIAGEASNAANGEFIVRAVNMFDSLMAVKAQHDDKARACNFSGCGCAYCAAIQEGQSK